MKKTILLLLLSTALFSISCTSDDDSVAEETFMTAKINGTLKDSTIVGVLETLNNSGETIISISGTLNPSTDGNLSDFIKLSIKKFETGTSVTTFEFPAIVKFNEVYYRDSDGTFTVNITRNDANVIEGTYSGQIREESNSDSFIEIIDGSFRYVYPN